MINIYKKMVTLFLSILMVLICVTPASAKNYPKMDKSLNQRNEEINDKIMSDKYPLSKAFLNSQIDTAIDKSEKIFIIQFEDGKRSECLEKMKKIEGLEIKYYYDTIFEGVSVKVRADKINEIRDMKGIKNIQENGTFTPHIESAKQMTKIKEAVDYYDDVLKDMPENEKKARHLDGRGTVVAVIDSGIDIGHETMNIDEDAKPYMKIKNHDPGFTDKVPHGFSYVGGGEDLMDKVIAGHGMHCAGIIAGNGPDFKGVVPNAQLLSYRIFSDSYYADEDFRRFEYGGDDSVYHAIDDAVKHGADVISMSIGQAGNGYAGDLYYETVNRATKKGVVIVSAIGNYSSSASDNTYDSNPINELGLTDTSAMTYYAGIGSTLAVGSTTNSFKKTKSIKINEKVYPYTTLGNKNANEKVMNINKGTMKIVYVGHGRESAYKELEKKGIDVKDKIVVAVRDGARISGSKIVEKIDIAARKGAKGIIIMNAPISYSRDNYMDYTITSYENDPEMSEIVKNNNIWAISVNGRDGEEIKKLSGENDFNIEFPKEEIESSMMPDLKISGFSGWGPNAELELKPEVVAPGENIYSTMNRNRYGYMSGTSMATPHVSGISSMLVQKVNKIKSLPYFKDFNKSDINKIILMNTAVPVKDYINKNIESSPRRQGAGIVQADRSILDNVIITYNKKGAVELKDFKDSSKAFTLRLDNTSDNEITYDIKCSDVLGESVKVQKKLALHPEKIKNGEFEDTFNSEEVKVTVPEKLQGAYIQSEKQITIPANSHKEVSFILNTPNVDKHFVEGYIYFIPKDNKYPEISIPYMGYKGDWQEGRIIDKPMWEDDSVFKHTTIVGLYADDGHGEEIKYKLLGVDPEAYSTKIDEKGKTVVDEERLKEGYKVDPDKIAFSSGFMASHPKTVTLRLIALREVKDLEVAILNDKKEVVRVISRTKNYRKQINNVIYESGWQNKVFHRPNVLFTWDGMVYDSKKGEMVYAPSGQYYYRVRAKVKDTDKFEETVMPVKVDVQGPHTDNIEYTFLENGTRDVKFSVKDNNDVMFVGASLDNKPLKVEKESDGQYIIRNLKVNEFTKSKLHIEAMDYAQNLMEPVDIDLNYFFTVEDADDDTVSISIDNEKVKNIEAYNKDQKLNVEKDTDDENKYNIELNGAYNIKVIGKDENNLKIAEQFINLAKITGEEEDKQPEKDNNVSLGKDHSKKLGPVDYEKMKDEENDEFGRVFNYGFDQYYILTGSNARIKEEDGNYYFNPDEDSWVYEFDKPTELDPDDYRLILTAYNTNEKGHEDYQPTWTKTVDGADGIVEDIDIPVYDGVNILNITAVRIDNPEKIVYSRGVLIMLDTHKPELQFEGSQFDDNKKVVYVNKESLNIKGSIKDNLDEVYLDINGDNILSKSKIGDFGNTKTDFETNVKVKDGDTILFETKDRFQNHKEIKYTVVMDTKAPEIEIDDKNLTKDSIIEPEIKDDKGIAEKIIFVNGKPYQEGSKLSEYGDNKFIIEIKAVDYAGNITTKNIEIGISEEDKKVDKVELKKNTFTKEEIKDFEKFIKLPEGVEIIKISDINPELKSQNVSVKVKNKLGVKEKFIYEINIIDILNEEIKEIALKNDHFLPEELTKENLFADIPEGVNVLINPIDASKPGEKDLTVRFIKQDKIIDTKTYKITILPELSLTLEKTRFNIEEIKYINKVVKADENFDYSFKTMPSDNTGTQTITIIIKDKFGHSKEMSFKVEVYEKAKPNKDSKEHDWDKKSKGLSKSHKSSQVENYKNQYNPVNETQQNDYQKNNTLLKKDLFIDINGHWAKDIIESIAADNIIKGYPDETFRPQANITRAEFATICNRIFGYTDEIELDFKDVKQDDWYVKDLKALVANKLILGDENSYFNPNRSITREEIASIIIRYMEKEKTGSVKNIKQVPFKDKENISEWAKDNIYKAYSTGILKGDDDNKINAKNKATRAEVVSMIYNLREIIKK